VAPGPAPGLALLVPWLLCRKKGKCGGKILPIFVHNHSTSLYNNSNTTNIINCTNTTHTHLEPLKLVIKVLRLVLPAVRTSRTTATAITISIGVRALACTPAATSVGTVTTEGATGGAGTPAGTAAAGAGLRATCEEYSVYVHAQKYVVRIATTEHK